MAERSELVLHRVRDVGNRATVLVTDRLPHRAVALRRADLLARVAHALRGLLPQLDPLGRVRVDLLVLDLLVLRGRLEELRVVDLRRVRERLRVVEPADVVRAVADPRDRDFRGRGGRRQSRLRQTSAQRGEATAESSPARDSRRSASIMFTLTNIVVETTVGRLEAGGRGSTSHGPVRGRSRRPRGRPAANAASGSSSHARVPSPGIAKRSRRGSGFQAFCRIGTRGPRPRPGEGRAGVRTPGRAPWSRDRKRFPRLLALEQSRAPDRRTPLETERARGSFETQARSMGTRRAQLCAAALWESLILPRSSTLMTTTSSTSPICTTSVTRST